PLSPGENVGQNPADGVAATRVAFRRWRSSYVRPVMVELSGSLSGVDLLPLARLLAELRQTGSLHLARGRWSARLDLREGRVVDGTFAEEHGLAALAALGLVMDGADFVFLEGPVVNAEGLDLTPDRLRSHLEAQAGIGVVALEAVPRPLPKSIAREPS